MSPRLEKLFPILACPGCKVSLIRKSNHLLCENCKQEYPFTDKQIFFIQPPSTQDELDSLKGRLKRKLGKYYYTFGISIIAPTFPFNYLKAIQKYSDLKNQIVLDIGSGNYKIHEDIYTVDIFGYSQVDIVCDIHKLPFQKGTIDRVCSRSVLEHVAEPEIVVNEFHRVTKKDGLSIHLIPFLFPFHASPYDFQRYTAIGQKILFKKFIVLEQTNATGPVSALLSIFTESLSIIFSFGNSTLKAYSYLFFCLLLFPFKYFDIFFVNRKSFLNSCASILGIFKKNE